MTDPLRYIDRIGRLKVGASSGSYVRVDSYDPETTEYSVTMLPDNQEGDDTHRVKAADIEFQTTPEFVDKFLNPPHFIIQGNLDMKNIPSGSIVDFTECTTDPIVDTGKLFVRGSYRFVGKISQSESSDDVLTCLPYCVYVGAQNEDDIIEFENMLFDSQEGSHNVVCLGGNIVFRRCAFRGVADGLKVGSGNARVNVLFEGGTVYCDGDHGATVDANAQLTMRDVAIGGSGVGVLNKGGGKLTLNQCSLNGNTFGVVMSGEESETEMTSCAFHSSKRCGVMADGGTLTMVDCTIDGARECGIIIVDQAGEVSATATIDGGHICGCRCGLRISGVGTCISNQLRILCCTVGVYLTSTSTGEVSLNGSKYFDNSIDVVNLSFEGHRLLVDNISLSSTNILQRVQEVHNVVIASKENIEKLGHALSTVWSLKVKRLLTQLAMHLPLPEDLQYTKVRHCHHCDRLETSTPGEPFKKCARCLKVCYCSKGCQDMHWGHHKFECRLPNGWYEELWRIEYVVCILCQKLMEKVNEEAIFKRHFVVCHTCMVNRSEEVALCMNKN